MQPLSQPCITRQDIEQAADRIRGYVRETPVIWTEPGAFKIPSSLALKLELLQITGSFKPRGAFNRILSAESVPDGGIVAASGGNHGIAAAHAARRLGYKANIFVPSISSGFKLDRLKASGAFLHIVGERYAESLAASKEFARESGALEVHAYDHPAVLAGAGTMAMEFDRQAPELDTVLIACGGGGLIGGAAAWYAGSTKVIGVEPERSRALHAALQAGRPVPVSVDGVAADSLGAAQVGGLMFPIAQAFVDRVVLVSDEDIIAAQKALWNEMRLVAEPGGAAALAAVLSGHYKIAEGERVGVVVCGSNALLGY